MHLALAMSALFRCKCFLMISVYIFCLTLGKTPLTLLYNKNRPTIILLLTTRGLSDGIWFIVTGTSTVLGCSGWCAELWEHSSNAAGLAVLSVFCHRKGSPDVCCVLFPLWCVSHLQKPSSLGSPGSHSVSQEYGWCEDSYIFLCQAHSVAGQVWWKLIILCTADLVLNDLQVFSDLKIKQNSVWHEWSLKNGARRKRNKTMTCLTIVILKLYIRFLGYFVCFLIIWNLCSFLWKGKYHLHHLIRTYMAEASEVPLNIMQKILISGHKQNACSWV